VAWERYRIFLLMLILLIGFAFRFYAANQAVMDHDEFLGDLPAIQTIRLAPGNMQLPIVDWEGTPMGSRYLSKASQYVFGKTLLGARLSSVLIGTLTILFVYLMGRKAWGIQMGLIAASLLSFSQYHIAISRLTHNNAIHLFVIVLSLLAFYTAIKNKDGRLFLLNALIIGFGFWFKESVVLLLVVNFIFLLLDREARFWLKNKYYWGSILLSLGVIVPLFCVSLMPQGARFNYLTSSARFGASLNATSLYLGELLLAILRFIPQAFHAILSHFESEGILQSWIMGVFALIAVIKYFKSKDPLLRLLVLAFGINFLIFSLISGIDAATLPTAWSLEYWDWSIFGFIPGLMLAAYLIGRIIHRHQKWGRILFFLLVTHLLIGAWMTAAYPFHCYFPVKDLGVRKLLDDYGTSWMTKEKHRGTQSVAKDIYKRILEMKNIPESQRTTARLKYVSIQKGTEGLNMDRINKDAA